MDETRNFFLGMCLPTLTSFHLKEEKKYFWWEKVYICKYMASAIHKQEWWRCQGWTNQEELNFQLEDWPPWSNQHTSSVQEYLTELLFFCFQVKAIDFLKVSFYYYVKIVVKMKQIYKNLKCTFNKRKSARQTLREAEGKCWGVATGSALFSAFFALFWASSVADNSCRLCLGCTTVKSRPERRNLLASIYVPLPSFALVSFSLFSFK